MAINPQDVKRLREATDAPMMECKKALEEAEGDFEKAKEILREKGKAAAAKRATRSTSQGIATGKVSSDSLHAAGVVVECETDFVAINPEFIKLADQVAEAVLAYKPAAYGEIAIEEALAIPAEGGTIGSLLEAAVAVIRENIQLRRAVRLSSTHGYAVYNHHDKKKTALIEVGGTASNKGETGFQVGVQVVAFPPAFLKKEDVPKDVIDHEIEIETRRAIEEGKKEDIARNIAQGRVNKEYYQAQVLLEQPFYLDPKKTTKQYVEEQAKAGGGTIEVAGFTYLRVGDNAGQE